MASILGLVDGADYQNSTYHNRNHRRRVFHDHPTGAAPLTGLLSLMETEFTDSADSFGWWEKRFKQPETTIGNVVAFRKIADGTTTAGSTFSTDYDGTDDTSSPYRNLVLQVVSSAEFQVGQIIMLLDASVASTTQNVKAIVTANDTTNNRLTIRFMEDISTINNDSGDQNGISVVVVGNVHAEGAAALTGIARNPIKVSNHTQIFRNAFSFTRTALKTPTDFDQSGIYKETAKDNAIDHMVEMEMAFLWGVKGSQTVTSNGDSVPERTTGGVRWFLEQWEKQNTGNGGAYDYVTGASAATANTDDAKRIINFSTGSVGWKDFNGYLERAFRTTNNRAFEKLFLCGSGVLAAINSALENRAVTNKNFRSETVYGMNITTWETPFGTVHFKTHPLFNRSSAWRYDGVLLDVQNLRYRPLNDSDTVLLKNRQNNGDDRRKDEWLTEAGLECRFPESHMWFENLQTITV